MDFNFAAAQESTNGQRTPEVQILQKKIELNHVRHDDDDVRSIPIRG
jgi:hypothetical protein